MRSNRIVLALEVVFGVVPITIVGGGYSLLGVVFGIVSVGLAIRERALHVFVWWLGVLGLAASGLAGIVGLWALVALSAASQPRRSPMFAVALVGSLFGVLAAVVILGLMLSGSVDRRPMVVYVLVAPILVVLHQGLALKRA